ncbi:MAG TPA: NUDIX domain-containing protein [Acidimicrobiales bacterium]|nr:NUDIX domain-containing protein [Acidimicrobiales bacterium]
MTRVDDELLDVYDDGGRLAGRLPRSVVHRDGRWHRVFHCLVVAGRSTGPVVVLQRRSRLVRAFPGLLDLTVAGHLLSGERPLDGVREAQEEMGLELDVARLVPLGVRVTVFASGEGRLDRELTHVYLVRNDTPLEDYRPDPDDVDDVIEVSAADLLGVFDTGRRVLGRSWRSGPACTVGEDDLVPNRDYWVTLLVMAERFANGRTPLAI